MVQHNAGKEGHNFGRHTVGEGEGVCRKTPVRYFYGVISLAESLNKARHGISLKALHGEAASVNSSSVSSSRSELQAITASYAQEDIYSMDETGFFIECHPARHWHRVPDKEPSSTRIA